MIFPRLPSWEGKHFRLVFALLGLAGLVLIGNGGTERVTAAAGCSLPAGQCTYLPVTSRALDPRVRAESLVLYWDMYYPIFPALTWSGGDIDSCLPGNINENYRAAVLRKVNYYRLMAGVPQINRFNSEYNQQAQAAALLMSANNLISHKPDEVWEQCPQLAPLAREGIVYSLAIGDLNGRDAVDAYMRDEGNGLVYLRRYVLYPQTVEMGDGDVPRTGASPNFNPAVNTLYVIDVPHISDPRPATRDEYVAWPPAAYVPYQVVPALWSFSFTGADFSQASVSMQENGQPLDVTLYPPQDCITDPDICYGESTLVWKAGEWGLWPKPVADMIYTVTVSNVLVHGQPRTFTYTVIVYDPGM